MLLVVIFFYVDLECRKLFVKRGEGGDMLREVEIIEGEREF